MTLNATIQSLPPGGSAEIGRSGDCSTHVERSGDGRTVRFVRAWPDRFEVFHAEARS